MKKREKIRNYIVNNVIKDATPNTIDIEGKDKKNEYTEQCPYFF
jgi:hypothetical protein